ncbi:MAG: efflux RND transporter permease subunit, partial [Candidatus Riflebacteria bacterium]
AGGRVWGLYTFEVAAEGQLDLQLIPVEKRKISTMKFISKIRPIIDSVKVPGGRAMVMPMPIKGLRKLGESDIEVKIRGENLDRLFMLAQQSAQMMGGMPELTNVVISLDMNKPEYHIVVDRQKAANLGIPVAEVARAARSLVTGAVASKFRDKNEYYNIRLMIPEKEMVSRSDIEVLPVLSSFGQTVRVGDVAQIVQTKGPVEIVREDQTRQVLVRCDAADRSVGEALSALKKKMEELKVESGVQISYGGQAQMIAEMIESAVRILFLASVLSFLVLMFQFNQIQIPFLIIAGIPFCLAGVVYAMALGKFALSATVLIGLIVLFAAAINDGVL